MEVLNEDDYEEMAAAFQCFQIQTLYQTLKENKIPESKIRKICEDFTFSIGVGIDQFWIESEVGRCNWIHYLKSNEHKITPREDQMICKAREVVL